MQLCAEGSRRGECERLRIDLVAPCFLLSTRLYVFFFYVSTSPTANLTLRSGAAAPPGQRGPIPDQPAGAQFLYPPPL